MYVSMCKRRQEIRINHSQIEIINCPVVEEIELNHKS